MRVYSYYITVFTTCVMNYSVMPVMNETRTLANGLKARLELEAVACEGCATAGLLSVRTRRRAENRSSSSSSSSSTSKGLRAAAFPAAALAR